MKHTRQKSNGMKRHMILLPVFLVAVVALILVASAQVSWGFGGWGEFAEAEIFFEENTTDGDLGIQFFLDGPPWKSVTILTPDWRRLIKVRVRGNAGEIGLTEFFSESAEPGFDELPRDEFLALFPPGEYRFFGWAVEGEILVGTATLTHDLPAAPEIDEPEEDGEPDDIGFIDWEDGDDNIVGWEVTAELVFEVGDEEIVYVSTTNLPAGVTELSVPQEFVDLTDELDGLVEAKVEVIAIEESGNKAITEVVVFEAPEEEE